MPSNAEARAGVCRRAGYAECVSEREINLILGGGGVRTIAHLGAAKALLEQGFTVASISGASAGSMIGALLAFNRLTPGDVGYVNDLIDWIIDLDLKRVVGRRRFLWQLRAFRPPFSRYAETGAPGLVAQRLGELTLEDLTTSYAATAVDMVSKRVLVYSTATHPKMDLREVLAVSTAAPLLFPPVRRAGRYLVDGAIMGNIPVWVPSIFGNDHPLVAIGFDSPGDLSEPENLGSFIGDVILSAIHGSDEIMRRVTPNLTSIRVPTGQVSPYDFGIKAPGIRALIDRGFEAASRFAPRASVGPSSAKPTPVRVGSTESPLSAGGQDDIAYGAATRSLQVFYGDVTMNSTNINAVGSIVAIDSMLENITQTVNNASIGAQEKSELNDAVAEFTGEVEKLKEEHAVEATLLTKKLDEALAQLSVEKEQRNPSLFQLSAKGLKEAAEAVADIAPGLVATAGKISAMLLALI